MEVIDMFFIKEILALEKIAKGISVIITIMFPPIKGYGRIFAHAG
jgi:hypothetical protein